MEGQPQAEGMFARLPIVVWAVVTPMIAMEVVLGLAGLGIVGGAEGAFWRIEAIQRFAFVPDLARLMAETGGWTEGGLVRFLSYPFVHLGLIDAAFMVALTLALGKVPGEALGHHGSEPVGHLARLVQLDQGLDDEGVVVGEGRSVGPPALPGAHQPPLDPHLFQQEDGGRRGGFEPALFIEGRRSPRQAGQRLSSREA